MILYPLEALRPLPLRQTFIVVGPDGENLRNVIGGGWEYIVQNQPLGTGHALAQTQKDIPQTIENLLVLNGDVPLISPQSLSHMMNHHCASGAAITLLTTDRFQQRGLGRILRNSSGQITEIIEEVEDEARSHEAFELNSGIYCFSSQWLWDNMQNLSPHDNGELYLTDMVSMAAKSGQKVESVSPKDPMEILGINNRIDLAQAEEFMQRRTREGWMKKGVTLLNPSSIFIDVTVDIGMDTAIYPNTFLTGTTRIGEQCTIGPNTTIRDSIIGDNCRIQTSMIEEATLEEGVDVGPYSHIRPDSHLEQGVHIGNFVEVKKSRLGRGTKMGHFSYVGDATIGANVNIGAGTITCNFDGLRKNRTIIEDDAFIGSDSMLVAPVRIGPRAITGAGSVVTHDVPADALVVGAPAQIKEKPVRKGGSD